MAQKSSPKWYALHVKKHKERAVLRQLEIQEDIEEIFFPTFRVEPKNPRASPFRPCFPGYIFLRLDLNRCGESAVRWLPGVKDLVRLGGEVVSIPGEQMEAFKDQFTLLEDEQAPGGIHYSIGSFQGLAHGGNAHRNFSEHLSDRERITAFFTFLEQGSYGQHGL